MMGQTVSHYKILEKLGEGGMGVVYKAHDTKLDRDVALKFLPQQIAVSDEDKARFLQEAKAASAVMHHNVCVIYDIAEHDGNQFIIMEYVDGQTISTQLKTGNLQLETAISYAIQIGDALQEAHSKGIVHRDIKTDNIMVNSKNQIKVMDFGLAKLKGSLKLTKTSSTVGTLAYMAPEQIQGGEVDARSDIFSFGVVMYEMLAGHTPFRGEHEAAMVYSIVNEEPLSLKAFQVEAPERLETIIHKCLEKDPYKRYQTAKEVTDDLKSLQQGKPGRKRKRPVVQWALAPAGILLVLAAAYFFWPSNQTDQEKSIVVLPFEDISPNKDNEYFSDGLTYEIINELSRVSGLDVRSRNASMAFKGRRKQIGEIAGEVHVRYVLEGTVRREGNDLRIAVELIDAKSDRNLWANTYPGTLNDVFDMQEQVSRSIVNALSVKLSPEESRAIAARPIDNVQAYDAYLKARREILQWTDGSFDNAKKYLTESIGIVGPNATLYGAMAYVHWNYANMGTEPEENIAKAEEYVQKAFALDSQSPEAHLALGLIYNNMHPDMKKSVSHLQAVLERDPHNYDALLWLTADYAEIGKMSAARACVTDMARIDPASAASIMMTGFVPFYEGRFDLALAPVAKADSMEPQNWFTQFFFPIVLAYNGKLDEARSVIDKHATANPPNLILAFVTFVQRALNNDVEGMQRIFTADWKKSLKKDPQMCQFSAQMFAMVGRRKEALDWLENAIDVGFANYRLIAEHDPFFAKFKDDERFKKLAQRMKTEWENFKD